MCSQALSTGPVLPPLFASVLTESRSRHPASNAGGTCARLREHHLKPSNSNRKIFPFPPSLFFIFFSPLDGKKEQLQRRRCCSCKLLFSSAWVVSCCQRKNDKPQKKEKNTSNRLHLDCFVVLLITTNRRLCGGADLIVSPASRHGNGEPVFFFFFPFPTCQKLTTRKRNYPGARCL